MLKLFTDILQARRHNIARGVYSVCSAHPWVIEAAMQQAIANGSYLLIEATSNQVDQFGGYTGMKPRDFYSYVTELAQAHGFDTDYLVLGGDHLGPNPWRHLPAEEAMVLAEELIAAYVEAGFAKIHLDTSMACGGDPERLDDTTVAARAARLCQVAEAASERAGLPYRPVYVVGTEVPVPGGADHALQTVEVTSQAAAQRTVDVHRQAFSAAGLTQAWQRVVALVVQPGVEFDHTSVVDYQPEKARDLVQLLEKERNLMFEAHSTDYQRPQAFVELVRDGFAILKVGPALTFALREALYALSAIEEQVVPQAQRARLPEVLETVMQEEPEYWVRYYHGDTHKQSLLRHFSYSDRVRYYWTHPKVRQASEQLIANLSAAGIPENLLSQHLPEQYRSVRNGSLRNDPKALALDAVRKVLRAYALACMPRELERMAA